MLRIRVFGELAVEIDGRAPERLAGGRARALLGWLALHPGLHPRSRVASVFWPDVLEESARVSLRTGLAAVRRQLGEPAAACIAASRTTVGIHDGPGIWIDAREFDRLLAAGRGDQALALCGGDLLSDLDDDWVLEARQAHRERVAALLGALGAAAEQAGDLDRAVERARERLALDPLSEDAARVLIARLARTGDRASAVAVYQGMRESLRRELRLAPSPETRALVQEIMEEREASTVRSPPSLPAALARGAQDPLVGRRLQLARLHALWRRVQAGEPAMATIAGEAGGGKTRLISAFAVEARDGGAAVLAGRCYEDGATPYAPFTEALRQHATWLEPTSDWVAAELARLLPELPADARPEGDPRDARHRLFEAVAFTLRDAARRGPVVLVVEDLHWADASTLLLLAHVARTATSVPLLVVGSFRPDGSLDALLSDLRRDLPLEELVLPGLSADEVGEFVSTRLGSRAPPELGELLQGRTGGNPLFVEESVRHLRELFPAATPEELVAAATTGVPHGVSTVIDRRLVRLADAERFAVTAAAVAGEAFRLDDVVAATKLDDDHAAVALDGVVAARLAAGEATAGRYHFAHALIRETVLAGLTATRQALLHRRIADGIERLPADRRESRLPDLARHLLDAHPLVESAAVAQVVLRAAERAVAQLAYEDAAVLLDRALVHLDLPDAQRATLLLALGDARARVGRAEGARHCFEETARLARAADDGVLLARAALGAAGLAVVVAPVRPEVRELLEEAIAGVDAGSSLRATLLARLAVELYYSPAPVRERLSEEALASGRRTGGRALLEALNARHVALWSPAHVVERLAIANELIEAARAARDREAELQGINWRVVDLLELGDLPAAEQAIEAHGRLADDLRLLTYAWYRPMWQAMLALLGGRPDEASRLAAEGARIGLAAEDDNARVLFGVQLVTIRVLEGDLTEADRSAIEQGARTPAGGAWRAYLAMIALTEGDRGRAAQLVGDGAAELDALPVDANWLYTVTTLAMGAWLLDDAAAAARLYPPLLPFSGSFALAGRGTHCTGSVALPLGLLAAVLGDDEGAERHLDDAVSVNERVGARPFAAAARYALSTVLERGGRREQAAELRSQAMTLGRGLGMTLPGDIARYF